MLSKGIRSLVGKETDAAAWDAIFRYFNQKHNKGDIGYQTEEKIFIKPFKNSALISIAILVWLTNLMLPYYLIKLIKSL